MTVKDITMENVNLEDGIVAKIGDKYIQVQVGYDNIESEDCDAYLDYTLYDSDYTDIDGGQIDYNSEEIDYTKNPRLAVQEVLDSFENEIDSNEFTLLSTDDAENFMYEVEKNW